MFVRTLGLAVVAVVLCTLGLQAGGGGKDKDTKDAKETPKTKKFEVPADAVIGKVKAVDMKANNFTITLRNGKPRTFAVDDKTEFWGPRGGDRGTGPKGLKDDCMAAGYEVKVGASKDGKTATSVYLSEKMKS